MTATGFRYGEHDTSYLAAGGMDGLRHLAEEFYRQMNSLPQAAAGPRTDFRFCLEDHETVLEFLFVQPIDQGALIGVFAQ